MRSTLLLCLLIFATTFPASGAQAALPDVKVHADIEFAEVDGVKLLMNLHLPQGKSNPPLLMYIHGGSWTMGNRNSCNLCWVAEHGYAVASVEYRMSSEAIFPAQIHDCKGALRWLRANQDKYGYNARRVVVAGASAGGQLAALMGTSGGVESLEGTTAGHTDQSSEVQGVINYYGASDFIMRSRNQPAKTEDPSGSVYKLFGGSVSDNIGLARAASPVAHVDASDPPMLILHGDEDMTVHLTQSARLKVVYQQHQLDAFLHVERGRGHGWKRTPTETDLVLAFLAKQLGEQSGQ